MSEILFLGTGAADWFLEDKSSGFFRRNSATLLNSDLMIDCGEHIFDFEKDFGCDDLYKSVTDILITHNHYDHFNKDSVLTLAKDKKIRVGASQHIIDIIGECENIEFITLTPYKEEKIGNYTVIPMLANHEIVAQGNSFAFHYIIKTPDNKTIFYGLDGAWLLRPTWQEMKKHTFDAMIFDCTVGDADDWRLFEHNTIPMLRTMIKEVKNKKLLSDGGVLIASHFAKTLHKSHEETVTILKELDMVTAFDGMRIEL